MRASRRELMRLEKIKIRGFGAIVDETFDFDPAARIVILAGENGQGKSTVFDAFRLATLDLYDDALRDSINWNCSSFEIDETFSLRGKKIRSIIVCQGAGAERFVTVEGEPTTYKNSEATKRLALLLNPKRFMSTSFAKQHELDIIETGPAERREYLKKLNDLTFVRPIRYLEAKFAVAVSTLISLRAEQRTLLDRAYSFIDLKTLPMTVDEYSCRVDERDAAVRMLADIARERSKIPTLEKLISSLETELTSKKTRLATLQATAKSYEDDLTTASDPKNMRSVESLLQQSYDLAISELDKKILDHGLAREEIEAEEVRVPPFKSEAYDEVVALLGERRADLGSVNKKLMQIEKGICPECGRPYDTEHKQDYEQQRDALAASITELESRQLELIAAKTARQTAESINNGVAKKLAWHDAQRPIRDDEVKKLNETLATSITRVRKETASEIDRLQALAAAARSNIIDIESGIVGDEERLALEKTNLESARSYDADGVLSSREAILVEQRDLASSIVAEYEEAAAYNRAAENSNAEVAREKSIDEARLLEIDGLVLDGEKTSSRITAARDILKKELPSFIIGRIVSQIELHMNGFLEQTYRGRYRVSIKEDRDALRIVYGPKDADVKRASGYERQIFSMAWKYAKERLDGVGILFLDEVDSEASDANSRLFYQTIVKLPYEQIIAISHRPQTREMLRAEHRAQVFEIAEGKITA
jgi:DNA repair exonuclease SbcCD ATPase subunit